MTTDASSTIVIEPGYRPGLIGETVAMHARYYAREVGFGAAFEAKVAGGLADFVGRLGRPRNEVWSALDNGRIVGTIAIDGDDLGGGAAHLRWFIVDDALRGAGVGRRLIDEALAFADRNGFDITRLWTLTCLEAAARLYEAKGFVVAEDYMGSQWGREIAERRYDRTHPAKAR